MEFIGEMMDKGYDWMNLVQEDEVLELTNYMRLKYDPIRRFVEKPETFPDTNDSDDKFYMEKHNQFMYQWYIEKAREYNESERLFAEKHLSSEVYYF